MFGACGWLVKISRIGYNADHTQAMLNLGRLIGPLAGESNLVILEKENDLWKVAASQTTWVS